MKMKHEMFVLYDSKALFYGKPLFFRSTGEALRSFMTVSNDMETQVGQNPEDFFFYHIGSYDDEKAAVEMFVKPISLGCAIEYKKFPTADLSNASAETIGKIKGAFNLGNKKEKEK